MAAPYTAGDVMDSAAALLNDPGKSLFTYAVQIPYLKMANQQLEQELQVNECPLNLISEYESTVTAGTITLSLPTSFFLPISLKERRNGSTQEADYCDMKEVANIYDLSLNQGTVLTYWDFRHNCINFVGATEARQVRLYYWRQGSITTESGSLENQAGANNFLAYKTAALSARFIRKQLELADALDISAAQSLELLIANLVKNHQGLRVRRRPFRNGRSRTWLGDY